MPFSPERLKLVLWYGCLFGFALGMSLMALVWSQDTGCQMDYCIFYNNIIGNNQVGFLVPKWVLLLLRPLGAMPLSVSFVVFALINAVFIAVSVKALGTLYPFLLLFSVPVYYLFLAGQLDGLTVIGIALGWFAVQSKKPYILGISIILLLIKPHLGLPVAILFVWWFHDWKVFIIPGMVVGMTLLIYGIDWPLIWVQKLVGLRMITGISGSFSPSLPFLHDGVNISFFPYGMLSWLALLAPMPKKDRLITVISATFLSSPYSPVYSLIVVLVLPIHWLAYIPVYIPYIFGSPNFDIVYKLCA